MGRQFGQDGLAARGLLSRGFVAATCCAAALALPFVMAKGHDPVLRQAIIHPEPDDEPSSGIFVPAQTDVVETDPAVEDPPQSIVDAVIEAGTNPTLSTEPGATPPASDPSPPETVRGSTPPARQPNPTTATTPVPSGTTPTPPGAPPVLTIAEPTPTVPATVAALPPVPTTTTPTEPATTTTAAPPETTTTLPEPTPTTVVETTAPTTEPPPDPEPSFCNRPEPPSWWPPDWAWPPPPNFPLC